MSNYAPSHHGHHKLTGAQRATLERLIRLRGFSGAASVLACQPATLDRLLTTGSTARAIGHIAPKLDALGVTP